MPQELFGVFQNIFQTCKNLLSFLFIWLVVCKVKGQSQIRVCLASSVKFLFAPLTTNMRPHLQCLSIEFLRTAPVKFKITDSVSGLDFLVKNINITSEMLALGSRLNANSQTRNNEPASKTDGSHPTRYVHRTTHVIYREISSTVAGCLSSGSFVSRALKYTSAAGVEPNLMLISTVFVTRKTFPCFLQ